MDFDKLDRQGRMESLRNNYQLHTDSTFQHFYCPILRLDQQVEMTDGHIIPANQSVTNRWIPQRKDVDSFYGSVFEADFKVATDIINGSLSFTDLLTNRPSRGPQIELSVAGKSVEFYSPKQPSVAVAGHTRGKLVFGEEERDIVFKIPSDELFGTSERAFQVVLDHDALPEMTATVLRSAFLTMFRTEGYNLNFTSAGRLLADILRKPFEECRGERPGKVRDKVRKHFSQSINMIRVMPRQSGLPYTGSVLDRRYLAVCGGSGRIFAIGIIVPMQLDLFCVFVPTEQDPSLETYFGFLREPPVEITVRLMEATQNDNDGPFDFVWNVSKTSQRVPFGAPLA